MEQNGSSEDGTSHERLRLRWSDPHLGNHGDHDVHEYTLTTDKELIGNIQPLLLIEITLVPFTVCVTSTGTPSEVHSPTLDAVLNVVLSQVHGWVQLTESGWT